MQDEVEMMVESLLDVLLQTLLSIMSKSQAVENSRNQRCPQCTAEITVSSSQQHVPLLYFTVSLMTVLGLFLS